MYLAIKEILHEKVRYSLILSMFILISYLILILTGLMLGLANENTAAVRSWDTETVFLNKNSNDSLSQSIITKNQASHLKKSDALVGVSPVVIENKDGKNKQNIQFVGLDKNQFIAQDKIQITSGRKVTKDNEIVLDEELKDKGYHLNQTVTINSETTPYKIVGFAKNAKLNIASLAYGSLNTWQQLKGTNSDVIASGIFSTKKQSARTFPQLKKYTVDQFIQKLPGYKSQNSTFAFMIGFLMVISLIIVAVFLYILTLQKLPNFAVLRAQGVPAKHLVYTTLAQAVLLVVIGTIGGLLLTILTSAFMPSSVPILMNWPLILILSGVMVIIGMAGALLPIRVILKIDPVRALN